MRAACSIKLAFATKEVIFHTILVGIAGRVASGTVISLIAEYLDQILFKLGVAGR
jgi:hypothetical protein